MEVIGNVSDMIKNNRIKKIIKKIKIIKII